MQMPAFENARSKFLARRSSGSSQDAAGLEGLVLSGVNSHNSLDLAAAARLARLTLSGEEFTPVLSRTAPASSATEGAAPLAAQRSPARESVHNPVVPARSPSGSDSGSISSGSMSSLLSESVPAGRSASFASDGAADDDAVSGTVSDAAPASDTEMLTADRAVHVPLLGSSRERWRRGSRDRVQRAEQQLLDACSAGLVHSVLSSDTVITQVHICVGNAARQLLACNSTYSIQYQCTDRSYLQLNTQS
jgi:hypothetical protein